jgi:hypothetical protein
VGELDAWWARSWRDGLALICVGAAAILICLPFMDVVAFLSDEGVLAHGAERMLRGQHLYTDFFEFLPPGGFVLTAAWLHVAGISFIALRVLAILSIAALSCFTFLSCRIAGRSSLFAAVLTIGWLILSQGDDTQLSHHWLTTLFAMVTVWASLAADDGRNRWPLIAGLAAGAAGMVTPTRGALVLLAGVASIILGPRRSWRAVAAYGIGAAFVPLALILWLALNGDLVAAFVDVILWTANNYASIQYVPFGSFADMQSLPLKFLFPAAIPLTFTVFMLARRTGGEPRRLLSRCAAFGAAGLVGCYPRPDIFHITYSSPLVLPLIALCLTWLARSWRPAYLSLATTLIFLPSTFTYFGYLGTIFHGGTTMATTRGTAVWFGSEPEVAGMMERVSALPNADGYFFYPTMAFAPFLTGREDVTKYDTYTPDYTTPSQYRDACRDATRRASWLVINRRQTDPAVIMKGFPAMRHPRPPETAAFEEALDKAFALVVSDGPIELRHRRAEIASTLCDGIPR